MRAGDGMHLYRVDGETGAWTHGQRVGDLVNPAFVAVSHDGRFLFSVPGDETYGTAFAVDRARGHLTVLNRVVGANGVHLARDPSGWFLLVANYDTGRVRVTAVRPDGSLADAAAPGVLPKKAPGRIASKAGSHPHQILFDHGDFFMRQTSRRTPS
jgi:6-phosphogluconolactonase (cycloisomerase 2 family)